MEVSEDDLDHLLIFGYESKVYRDDEKAKWIEDGNHLIPLLGDSSVLIDRYDGRGALVDLKAFEPSFTPALNALEKEIERMCDLERYWDCKDDEELEIPPIQNGTRDIQQAEDSKKYAMFEYSYDSPEEKKLETEDMKKSFGSKDHTYAPPAGLYLPPDLVLPKTMKSHAIIEKTAKFIASQGIQMEIILKTKQMSNAMFNFLTYNDVLNPYYQYLVAALKTNAYKPEERVSRDESPPFNEAESDDEDAYLHPSLVAKPVSVSESMRNYITEYKSTGPSAYSALVSKIQEMDQPLFEQEEEPILLNQSSNSTREVSTNRILPTGETQIIIEKMANYVAKNGQAFESLASMKGDPRFTFLDSSNEYHWYYISCKQHYEANQGGVVASEEFVPYISTEFLQEFCHGNSNTHSTSSVHLTENTLPTKSSNTMKSTPPPNHANAINRMATLPPALIDKIELLRRKTLENRAKELSAWEHECLSKQSQVTRAEVRNLKGDVNTLSTKQELDVLPPTSVRLNENLGKQTREVEGDNGNEIQRKAERRKRAALFLETIKTKEKSLKLASGIGDDDNDIQIVAEIQRSHNVSPSAGSDGNSEVEEIGRISASRRMKRSTHLKKEEYDKSSSRRKKVKEHSSFAPSSPSVSDDETYRSSRKKKSSKKKKRRKSKSRSSSEKPRRRR